MSGLALSLHHAKWWGLVVLILRLNLRSLLISCSKCRLITDLVAGRSGRLRYLRVEIFRIWVIYKKSPIFNSISTSEWSHSSERSWAKKGTKNVSISLRMFTYWGELDVGVGDLGWRHRLLQLIFLVYNLGLPSQTGCRWLPICFSAQVTIARAGKKLSSLNLLGRE
jgi:hypothetical protein